MIYLNTQTVAGVVVGLRVGRMPLPWMMMETKVACVVWDRQGRRANLWTQERIVLQGEENVKAYVAAVRKGTGILATGQRVPAFSVAADSDMRGQVLLASLLQVQNPQPEEKPHA